MKKEVYPFELKLEVVQRYLSGSIGTKRLAKEYHIASTGDIRLWLERYKAHGEDGLKNLYHEKYSLEFKKTVVEYMNKTGSSQQATAAHFNIPSRETVRRWQRQYSTQGELGLIPKAKGRKTMGTEMPHNGNRSVDDIKKENAQLRMEIDYLKKLYALIQSKEQQHRKK